LRVDFSFFECGLSQAQAEEEKAIKKREKKRKKKNKLLHRHTTIFLQQLHHESIIWYEKNGSDANSYHYRLPAGWSGWSYSQGIYG
jgi:hypothetical protein